jgi:hypothetical protein
MDVPVRRVISAGDLRRKAPSAIRALLAVLVFAAVVEATVRQPWPVTTAPPDATQWGPDLARSPPPVSPAYRAFAVELTRRPPPGRPRTWRNPMSHDADIVDGAIASAKHWLIVQGVAVEHWPPRGPHADHHPSRRPIIFLVDPGADPPRPVDDLATWMQLPGSVSELQERAQTVLMRARASGTVLTYVDDGGVLRVGDRMVILPAIEAEIMRVLLDRVGSVVGRDEINAAVWPHTPATDNTRLNSRVKHLRALISELPVRIHSVRGRGLLVEITPASKRAAPQRS